MRKPKLTLTDKLVREYKCKKCKKYKLGIYFNRGSGSNLGDICKECQPAAWQESKKYLCPECNQRTNVININELCPSCNKKFGLQQCIKCNELKFILVEFNSKKTICDDCVSL